MVRQSLRVVAVGHYNISTKKQLHCCCCDCSWSASVLSSVQVPAICCTESVYAYHVRVPWAAFWPELPEVTILLFFPPCQHLANPRGRVDAAVLNGGRRLVVNSRGSCVQHPTVLVIKCNPLFLLSPPLSAVWPTRVVIPAVHSCIQYGQDVPGGGGEISFQMEKINK